MEKKRIVITGASGFLGRHVVDLFQSDSCAFLLNTSGSDNALGARERVFYTVDDLAASFPKPDVVIHLAAFIPYGKFNEPSQAFEEVNVRLTQQLASVFPDARWVLASSVSVYGPCEEPVITVHTKVQPETLYAASKWRAEQIVNQLSNAAIIRFSSLIGTGMKPISLVPKWIEQAKNEKKIRVWGSGTRVQNYLDVRDAAALVQILATSHFKGTVLGIARMEYSNSDVAQLISERVPSEITHTPHRDERGFHYDDHAIHELIGFMPKFELRETIRQMIES